MLKNYNITLIELSLPLEVLLWALWFAAFNSVEASGSYSHARFFDSYEWALLFLAVAAFQLLALFKFRRARRAALSANIILWTFWLAMFSMANYQSHAVPICLYAVYQNVLAWQRVEP